MIRIQGLEVRQDRKPLLQEIDLDVPAGEALGVVGANGSGKSLLLAVLAGQHDPTRGRVLLDELDLTRERAKARRKVGWMPQHSRPWPHRKTGEVLSLLAELGGIARADVGVVVAGTLELVGLAESGEVHADALSTGQQRRLALACALVHEPPVLLLDHPFAGLDLRGREELIAVLEALVELGRTLLVASHDNRALEAFCTGFVVLEGGRIVRRGPLSVLAAEAGVVRELRLTVPDAEKARLGLAGRPGIARVIAEPPDLLRVVPGPEKPRVSEWWQQLASVGQSPEEARWAEPTLDDVLWSLDDASL